MTVGNDPDTLVRNYLARLEVAAEALPVHRRSELLDEVRGHIAEARAVGTDDEISVRTMLDRLGTPEEIVAAAQDGMEPDARTKPRLPILEIIALLLLAFAGYLVVGGWIAGAVLLWPSRRWRVREKLLGTLVHPAVYLGLVGMEFVPFRVPLGFQMIVAEVIVWAVIAVLVLRVIPGRDKPNR